MKISELEPKIVFSLFEEITQVPRPSKREEKIRQWLIDFANKHSLEYKSDKIGNIVIYKAAQNSDSSKTIIVQSHIDMVCEKNSDKEFNFDTDPIEAYIDGEWICANGTTLGADCGIGMALELALLADKNISHPNIEALFTVDEETGLTGAFGLDSTLLKGEYLINLDSEDEGEIFVGCAGGVDTLAHFPISRTERCKDFVGAQISIKGLKGGHSGDDINKGYANANILLARLLLSLMEVAEFELLDINGGNLRNAIPREAYANIAISNVEALEQLVNCYNKTVNKEFSATEGAIECAVKSIDITKIQPITKECRGKILESIFTATNGIVSMSFEIENLVESSSNLASIKIIDEEVVISTSQRSSSESRKKWLKDVMNIHFSRYGANVKHSDGYPGWSPKMDSELLQCFKSSYSELFGKAIAVKAIHAGLECGLFLEKYPHLDMVSLGPTLRRVHSPEERLEISTVTKCWDLLLSGVAKL